MPVAHWTYYRVRLMWFFLHWPNMMVGSFMITMQKIFQLIWFPFLLSGSLNKVFMFDKVFSSYPLVLIECLIQQLLMLIGLYVSLYLWSSSRQARGRHSSSPEGSQGHLQQPQPVTPAALFRWRDDRGSILWSGGSPSEAWVYWWVRSFVELHTCLL